jgi:hypothetical protein
METVSNLSSTSVFKIIEFLGVFLTKAEVFVLLARDDRWNVPNRWRTWYHPPQWARIGRSIAGNRHDRNGGAGYEFLLLTLNL